MTAEIPAKNTQAAEKQEHPDKSPLIFLPRIFPQSAFMFL